MTYLDAITTIHVAISLIAIASGFVVLAGMIVQRGLPGWNAFFLATTIATSVTGFLFPFKGVTPGIVIGVISLAVLAVSLFALYSRHLAGVWRSAYVITAAIAQYLNFFVLIVQSFKHPPLQELAPNGNEPPFAIAQTLALVAFIGLGVLATLRFKPIAARSREIAG